MTNYSGLELGPIVMHQVRRTDDPQRRFEVHLTDEPVVLESEDRTFLTMRFLKVLSNRGVAIIADSDEPSEVRTAVLQMWAPGTDFVAQSKSIAMSLSNVQPGSALAGLLMVAQAKLGGDDLLVVAKVEHQEAMRLEPTTNAVGHQVYEVEHIRDLVFGDAARIYKVAVFSRSSSAAGIVGGELVDEQNGRGFAEYFLTRFLGMKLREEPAVLTERFLTGMTAAINQSTMGAEAKIDAQSSLLSELNSNTNFINPNAFIQAHIPAGHGSEIRHLAEASQTPTTQFAKDTSRVDTQTRRMRVDLANGVLVIAPPSEIGPEKSVRVEEGADGTDLITIQGSRITSLKSTGGR